MSPFYDVFADGSIASGSAVIDDKNKKKQIKKGSARKLYAIDMEAYAVAYMQQVFSATKELKFLVIKSVSDIAADKEISEGRGGKLKAIINSSRFTYDFIKHLEETKQGRSVKHSVAVNTLPNKIVETTKINVQNDNTFQFDFSASYSNSEKITFKLKLTI